MRDVRKECANKVPLGVTRDAVLSECLAPRRVKRASRGGVSTSTKRSHQNPRRSHGMYGSQRGRAYGHEWTPSRLFDLYILLLILYTSTTHRDLQKSPHSYHARRSTKRIEDTRLDEYDAAARPDVTFLYPFTLALGLSDLPSLYQSSSDIVHLSSLHTARPSRIPLNYYTAHRIVQNRPTSSSRDCRRNGESL